MLYKCIYQAKEAVADPTEYMYDGTASLTDPIKPYVCLNAVILIITEAQTWHKYSTFIENFHFKFRMPRLYRLPPHAYQ